jgi:LysM repeat protein
MKYRQPALWTIGLLLSTSVLSANDDATIYGGHISAARATETATRLSATPEPVSKPESTSVSTPATIVPAQTATPAAIPAPTPVSSEKAVVKSSSSLPPASGKTYKVKPGDNLYRIGKSNDTTLETIKALNHLKNDHIYVGQVLKLPQAGFVYRPPQPVQPMQTASQPAPIPAPNPTPTQVTTIAIPSTTPTLVTPAPQQPAPTSATIRPATTASVLPGNQTGGVNSKAGYSTVVPASARQSTTASAATPVVSTGGALPTPQPGAIVPNTNKPAAANVTANTAPATAPTVARLTETAPAGVVSPNSVVRIPHTVTLNEAQSRLVNESEHLAKQDLGYDQTWFPPGESKPWDMDCSNTSRYIYKRAIGLQLPRCASDQYYDLKQKNLAWDVPLNANSQPDVDYLERNLRVGDLLFWEHTYKPERDPPITHVTIYLGKDAKGRMMMAGSQSSSYGKYGTKRGGPNIYIFEPLKTAGGYSTWFGFVQHKGRFVAFGRPLGLSATQVASAQ